MSAFTRLNCLREKKQRQLMPTTKHELLDWLMDVPEDAEIGTDGAGLALLAILGTNVHLLEVGHIPNADELYAEAINQAIMERLRRIHAAGGETETGVSLCHGACRRATQSADPRLPVILPAADLH